MHYSHNTFTPIGKSTSTMAGTTTGHTGTSKSTDYCSSCTQSDRIHQSQSTMVVMCELQSLIDTVSSVVSECLHHSVSEDLSNPDLILTSLLSCSSQIGSFLDEILVTRQRQVDEGVLVDLRQLHICLNQLCLHYEAELFIHLSGSTVTEQLQVAAQQGLPKGRPKKIINLAMVCVL